MKKYSEMSKEELLKEKESLEAAFKEYKEMGLSLNMARGKPSVAQLELSMPMMDTLHSEADMVCEDGSDCRNYGVPVGIPEARRLMGSLMEDDPENVFVFGNSSLNIMYDQVARSYTHGLMGNPPFSKQEKIKWLCPVPGYDRHFKITEYFGAEMINIPMGPDGPDMDMVRDYVENDPTVKGIWCVPKFSNPTGIVYSPETVFAFAALKPAAPDFRIYWDNAYCVHFIYDDDHPFIPEILSECEKAGHPDMVFKFASCSKITFGGSGISAMASSKNNLEDIKKTLTIQTIGHDKMNQLRHARFLKDHDNVIEHMKKHAAILRPKFELLEATLDNELISRGIGGYFKPKGGYFIAYEGPDNTAKATVSLASECGVVLTGAGAPFPYGKDPDDKWIRLAPSFPTLFELEKASEIFAVCARLAYVRTLTD